MEQLKDLFDLIGGAVSTVILPLLGVLLFHDQKKRKEEAAARKAEADNITAYAAEWKELYEKKEAKVHELDAKIDQMYIEKNEDREKIREMQERCTSLELENLKLKFMKCEVRGCDKRQPPSGY